MTLDRYLAESIRHPVLRRRARRVLAALPERVRTDLLGDANFSLIELGAGPADSPIELHGPVGLNRPGRTVVLRSGRLVRASADAACYIIAHELAHAWLCNGGRWAGEDPEAAADALAEQWGFAKPRQSSAP